MKPSGFEYKAEISDCSEFGTNELTVSLIYDSYRDEDQQECIDEKCLFVKIKTKEREFSVVLYPVEKRHNGLIRYRFSSLIKDSNNKPLSEDDYQVFEKILKKQVYHLAKGIYHEHEAENDRDDSLEAIIEDENNKTSLDGIDNVAIQKLLETYSKIFQCYAKEVSQLNKETRQAENIYIYYEWAKKKLRRKEILQKIDKEKGDNRKDALNQAQKELEEVSKWIEEQEKRQNFTQKKIKRFHILKLIIFRLIGKEEKEEMAKNIQRWKHYLDTWQRDLRNLEEGRKIEGKYKKRKKEFDELQIRLENKRKELSRSSNTISRLCEHALVEYTYCKTLLESKYNCAVNKNSQGSGQYRRMALNIRNSIRYVENVRYINQNRINRFSTQQLEESRSLIQEVQYSGKQSEILGWFALSVSLVPLFWTLTEMCCKGQNFQIELKAMLKGGIVLVVALVFGIKFWVLRHRKKYKESKSLTFH